MQLLKQSLLPVLFAAIAADHARAQFPGDLFFQDPAIAIEEGGQAELVVETFVGTSAFGLATFDLFYDPLLFELESVEVSTETLDAASGYGVELADRFAQAVVNDTSLTAPFGSVELVRILGRPLAPAGQSVQLTLSPRAVLDTQGQPIGSPAGFSATITVTAPAALTAASTSAPPPILDAAYPIAPWLDPLRGGVPYRRPGHVVRRWSLDQGPRAAPLLSRWKYVDASAPRDY
jgi:hypothetical protein